jgi:ribonuclease HI
VPVCETLAVPHRRPRRKGGSLKDGERRQIARAARHAGAPGTAFAPQDNAVVLCDGGSRGNPGPSAIAAVLIGADGLQVATAVEAIGRATAATAEYRALLLGLELAAAHRADPVDVCSDSRLAIAAVTGRAPTDPELGALVHDIRRSARYFERVHWRWHPRADNEAADALVRDLLWSN